MGLTEKVEIVRRFCPVFLILDNSISMQGSPIKAVNDAMKDIVTDLTAMNENNPDVQIRIAVIAFNTNVSWVTGKQLIDPASLEWKDLTAEGVTSMGKAFLELESALSVSKGIMDRASGSVAPVIFLLSDGEPTDSYMDGLSVLKENNWYKVAGRVAIGYGAANETVLREFTGNAETVLHADKPMDLKQMIRFVTITSSMVASKGTGSAKNDDPNNDPDDKTKEIGEALKTAPSQLSSATDPGEVW